MASVRSAKTRVWQINFGIFIAFLSVSNVLFFSGYLGRASIVPALKLPLIEKFAAGTGRTAPPEIEIAASAYLWLYVMQLAMLTLVPVMVAQLRVNYGNVFRAGAVTNTKGFGWIALIAVTAAISMNATWFFEGLFGRSSDPSGNIEVYFGIQLVIHSLLCGFMSWFAITIISTLSVIE